MIKFRELNIGQQFDWINDKTPGDNSFFETCKKISPRKYEGVKTGMIYKVGSINANVFHVKDDGKWRKTRDLCS